MEEVIQVCATGAEEEVKAGEEGLQKKSKRSTNTTPPDRCKNKRSTRKHQVTWTKPAITYCSACHRLLNAFATQVAEPLQTTGWSCSSLDPLRLAVYIQEWMTPSFICSTGSTFTQIRITWVGCHRGLLWLCCCSLCTIYGRLTKQLCLITSRKTHSHSHCGVNQGQTGWGVPGSDLIWLYGITQQELPPSEHLQDQQDGHWLRSRPSLQSVIIWGTVTEVVHT